MLHDIVKKGSVDRSVTVRIIDSTDGTPETGVVFNTAGIDLWYRREVSAVVSITEATLAALTTAHTDGGFLTISHGYYRLDPPDAAFATGANHVDFGGTVTGMVVIGGRVRLVDYDPEDTVRMGLTALPASGTLVVETGDSFARLGAPAGASVSADVAAVKVDTAAILVDTGTTLDGRIPAALGADGFMKASVFGMMGTALTETAGLLAAAFKKFFNVATPTGTVNSIPDAVAGAASGIAIVGSVMGKSPATLATADVTGNLPADLKAVTAGVDFSATMKTALNAATPASVGSVTADVGITQAGADKVWGTAARTLTSFGTLVADVWAYATRILTANTNFNDPTAAVIADAVWDEVLTGATHNISTSAGRRLRQVEVGIVSFEGTIAGAPSTTVIPLDASASATNNFYRPGLAIIVSSFGSQFARIDSYDGTAKELTLVSALATVPVNGDVVEIVPWASVRVSEIDPGLVVVPADLADMALNSTVAKEATLSGVSGRIPAALVGGRMDSNVGALNADATAAANLTKSASVIYQGSVTGAAATTTLIDSALTQAAADFWKGRIVIFTSGALKYQATDISAFDPATDKLTFASLTAAPSLADAYVIV